MRERHFSIARKLITSYPFDIAPLFEKIKPFQCMLREGAVVLLMRTNKNIFSTLIIGLCFRTMLVNLKKYIDTFNFVNGY